MTQAHIDQDVLEQYAIGSLSEEVVKDVDEHLLVCDRCREALLAADDFVKTIRAAAKALRSAG